VDSVADLFSAAEKLAADQKIDRAAMKYLFARSRLSGLSREQWEKEARLAGALYTIMQQSRRAVQWEQIVDLTAVDAAFAALKSASNAPRGNLLLTFHGAATPVVQELYKRRCEVGVILGSEVINRQGIRTFGNSRDTLFAALNVLRDGGTVLMAPDGFRGQQSAQFNVLGVTTQGGGGAAFLAHTARCNTAWYNFVRDGDRFVPVIEAGPTRLDGETLAAFSDRLYEFYAKQVEAIFSGDPRNIELSGRWARAFASAVQSSELGRTDSKAVKFCDGVMASVMSLLVRWRKVASRPDVPARAKAGKRRRPVRRRPPRQAVPES